MSSEFDQMLEDTLDEFRKKRAKIVETQKKMNDVTGTATAPRKVVTITVGRAGEVIDVKFPTGMYKRMAPAELASVIQATIDEARASALKQTADLLRGVLPAGLDADAVVSGDFDVSSAMPDFSKFMPTMITSIEDVEV
jgi:DNA-binding protein YbaB